MTESTGRMDDNEAAPGDDGPESAGSPVEGEGVIVAPTPAQGQE